MAQIHQFLTRQYYSCLEQLRLLLEAKLKYKYLHATFISPNPWTIESTQVTPPQVMNPKQDKQWHSTDATTS